MPYLVPMHNTSTANEILRIMCGHGMNATQVAALLHVAPRTVRAWLSGQNPAPYMAAELLRRIVDGR